MATQFHLALDAQLDSMVYFWRCSIDSAGNGGYNWYERSFQHIPGKRGWGQAHYFQFKNNDFSSITYDRPERDFDLLVAPHEICKYGPEASIMLTILDGVWT